MNEKLKQAIEMHVQALQSKDEEKVTNSFAEFAEQLATSIMQEANALNAEQLSDAQVLAARNVRQLTSEEKAYYQTVIDAMNSSNPRQALTDIKVTFPETVSDEVFKDIKKEHPLLNEIDFQNTSISTKWLYSTSTPEGVWGKLTDKSTKEVSATFKMRTMTLMKLSAFMYVPKDFLQLGMGWLDRYARELLVAAFGNAMEKAIVTNVKSATGPISMRANMTTATATDISGEANLTFTAKLGTTPLNDLKPKTLGKLFKPMTKDDDGNVRSINGENPILVVSQGDYVEKFVPATTLLSPNGNYVYNVLPFGLKIIPSNYMEDGKAILGLGKRYAAGLGIGTGKNGRAIEFSDEYKFLEDDRTYLIKGHGNGFPKDNNAFELVDVSKFDPELATIVETKTKEAAKAA